MANLPMDPVSIAQCSPVLICLVLLGIDRLMLKHFRKLLSSRISKYVFRKCSSPSED